MTIIDSDLRTKLITYGQNRGLSKPDAEDAIQEAQISLIERETPPDSIEAYVKRAIRNKACDQFKKKQRENEGKPALEAHVATEQSVQEIEGQIVENRNFAELVSVVIEQFIVWGQEGSTYQVVSSPSDKTDPIIAAMDLRYCYEIIQRLPYTKRHLNNIWWKFVNNIRAAESKAGYIFKDQLPPEPDDAPEPENYPEDDFEQGEEVSEYPSELFAGAEVRLGRIPSLRNEPALDPEDMAAMLEQLVPSEDGEQEYTEEDYPEGELVTAQFIMDPMISRGMMLVGRLVPEDKYDSDEALEIACDAKQGVVEAYKDFFENLEEESPPTSNCY